MIADLNDTIQSIKSKLSSNLDEELSKLISIEMEVVKKYIENFEIDPSLVGDFKIQMRLLSADYNNQLDRVNQIKKEIEIINDFNSEISSHPEKIKVYKMAIESYLRDVKVK